MSTSRVAGTGHDGAVVADLSDAELRALQAVADLGCILKAARALGISDRTVEAHLAACRRKLGCISTTQAVATGLRRGVIR